MSLFTNLLNLSAIKSFFRKSIYELKSIQPYFDFPWKALALEDVQEAERAELDVLESSIAGLE